MNYKEEIQKAIDDEDYKLAAKLKKDNKGVLKKIKNYIKNIPEEDIVIGKFQQFNYPKYIVETLHLPDYEIATYKSSKFIPGKTVPDKTLFNCPRCNKRSEFKQEHGDAYKCGKCGLKRQSFGTCLFIWEDNK